MTTSARYLLHFIILALASGAAGFATRAFWNLAPIYGGIAGAVVGILFWVWDPFYISRRKPPTQ